MCHLSYNCLNYIIQERNKICAEKIRASTEADKCEKSSGDKSADDSEHHHDNQHQQGGLGQHLHLADAGEEGGDEAGLEAPLASLLVVRQPLFLRHLRQGGLVNIGEVIFSK